MSVDDEYFDGIGRRVRTVRKLAGMTQPALASRANVSLSLIKKVEAGFAPASPAFVAAVARALQVDSTRLMNQPYEDDRRPERRAHAVIPGLRRELAAYRLPPDESIRPRSLDELKSAVNHTSKLRHLATLDTLGSELPGLLAELRAAAAQASGHDVEQLYCLLAEAYAAAGQVAYKLGYADLSSLTTERVEWAASRSADPLASAAADFYVAGELIANAEWAGALTYLETARRNIEDELRGDGEAALAMYGQLHLKSGLAAARAGDGAMADDHLLEARQLARRVKKGSDHYRLAFDADSVNIWSVGLAVERQDGTEAVKRADGLRFSSSTPRERVGHHWIDLARGYQLHGDRDSALKALRNAKKISPQQARYHPQFRETLVTLAESDRRRSDTVSSLARWVGIRA
ncbi:Transcriptional regulator, contains XRE-family HTH domain [Amycolatopsis pretoriensis]|uniref:Transcriptional regulator, contains XRE-family HTH domain n=1 Tax=Amycolatopsis pretoriensis TaxID=218821 RepID=A0A1H5RKS6_9PSEU|nr:helix-turn-helix domain-containing protein [Amycolatopsis pretoriensis]SEF38117.1 Transcriptional regulator, contains XRE-family HTH domain [Amycolatopsis pretoriensis]